MYFGWEEYIEAEFQQRGVALIDAIEVVDAIETSEALLLTESGRPPLSFLFENSKLFFSFVTIFSYDSVSILFLGIFFNSS